MSNEDLFDFLKTSKTSIKPIIQQEYLCGGELKLWNGPMQDVYSAVCEYQNSEIQPLFLGRYPLLDEQAALDVLIQAKMAWNDGRGHWATMSPVKRIQYFRKFLSEFKRQRQATIQLLMLEIGKSKGDSEKEFDRTVEYIAESITYYQGLLKRYKTKRGDKNTLSYIHSSPRGITLCMGPYNYPLNESYCTLVPALLSGNVVIFKPPRLGVLLHKPMLKIMQEVFPKGVIGTVYGEGQKVISPLMSSGKIDVLAFIGSSRVADILKKLHPKPHRLHTILGLEAKNAAIILKGANLKKSADECVVGSLSYNGQRCTALKLIFVETSIANEFVRMLSDKISSLKLANPWDNEVAITPLPSADRVWYMSEIIDDAKRNGASVINRNGGKNIANYFYPALLYPVSKQMRVYWEEQFGPVVPVATYNHLDEIIETISESNYGQQISIFGKNTKQLAELTKKFQNQVCRININSQCQRGPDMLPFTGRKDSAEGVLSVKEAFREFTIPLVISTKRLRDNNKILRKIRDS